MEKQSLFDRAQFFIKRKLLERHFSSKEYWNLRYQHNWNSGVGSYGDSSTSKAKVFNQLIKDYNINSVIEFGCGDGNQLALYKINQYLGLDVAKVTIKNIMAQYANDNTKSFMWYDPDLFKINSHFLKADAAISVDVIFHLVEDSIFNKYMQDMFSCSDKYVFIYATNHDDAEKEVAHVKNRKFTGWIEKNLRDWELIDTRPAISDKGEKFLDWFIYKKK